jgi:predicted N-acyltransferase
MTPATGPRLLSLLPENESAALVEATISWVEKNQLSSWHINFVAQNQLVYFESEQLLKRSDIQFHWKNMDRNGRCYESFDEFLGELKAKKRKNIVRERKPFKDNDEWSFCWLDGNSATTEDWQVFDEMYRNTFDKKGGWAQLAPDFFAQCATVLPEQTLLLLVKRSEKTVAGAFFMKSDTTLFGRYWGCFEEVEFLHFETCYYQGIEYAIKHGLKVFEPGAQGEHKLARGFLPVFTHSYHYVAKPNFKGAIHNAVAQEEQWLELRHQDYLKHSPYKDL